MLRRRSSGDGGGSCAESQLLTAVQRAGDGDEQRVAAVCRGDGVGVCGGAVDRCAEVAVAVATLPLIGGRGRRLAPAAARDLKRLCGGGGAADRRLGGRDEGGAAGRDR